MPSPSPVLVVAMADTSVRLIDTRSSIVQQELKVASGTLGKVLNVIDSLLAGHSFIKLLWQKILLKNVLLS